MEQHHDPVAATVTSTPGLTGKPRRPAALAFGLRFRSSAALVSAYLGRPAGRTNRFLQGPKIRQIGNVHPRSLREIDGGCCRLNRY